MKYTSFLMALWTVLGIGCGSQSAKILETTKIDGVSFVAARDTINDSHVEPLLSVGANYAAIMPFGFIRDLSHPEVIYNTERQWYGERKVGVKQNIQLLKKRGLQIMMKPQLWIWHGEFTGHLKMTSEADWKLLETSYTSFILEFAKLSEESGVEILCIGTELENFIIERPEYWSQLILKIKEVYKGKLTYAANWDEYKRVPFWDQLEYIGIDAYFPISDEKTPSIEECMLGWQPFKVEIKELSDSLEKPVLFTEFGYRNVDYTAKEPWKSDRDITTNNEIAQGNATQALFDTFWEEEWFAGGFLWKWFHNHKEVGGNESNQFTPQNKLAESIIKNHYTRD